MMNAKWRVVGGLASTLLVVSSLTFADSDQASSKTKSSTSKKTTSTTASHSSNSKNANSKTTKAKTSSASSSSHKGKKSRKSAKRGQQKIDSERTQQIQEALIKQHYLTGEPTGKWDANTEEALRKFQGDNGWQNKTVPDSRALIKLGLGPNHDHLLNPESAMTSVPDTRSASNLSTGSTARRDSPPQTQPQQ